MADLMLAKPAAGQQVVLADLAEDSRLVLGFSPADASMERAGDNLVFTFDDGSSLVLENFYTAYTSETIPDFEVDGAELSGADFFAALDSDLMPAAGPAAGPTDAARNAAYRTWNTSDLMDGIDRLGGLDLGWNGEPEQTEDLWGLPDDTPNFAPTISIGGVVSVVEAGVFVGGNQTKAGTPTAGGQVVATDANGDALSFGFLGPDGSISPSLTTPYGTISIGPDGAFTYTLNNDAANGLAEGQVVPENFTVVVTDSRGTSSTAPVTVNVTGSNDVPGLELGKPQLAVSDDGADVVQGAISDAGRAVGDDPDAGHELRYSLGHDADGNPVTSVTDEYGTLTIDPVTGAYTYTLDKDSQAVQKLGQDDSVTRNVTVVVTDEYGAHAERPLAVTIKGANDAPVVTAVTEHVRDTGVYGEDAAAANNPTRDYTGPGAAGHIKGSEHRLEAAGQLQGFDAEGDTFTFGVKTDGITPGGTLTLINPDNPTETTAIKVVSVTTDHTGRTSIVTEAGTFTLNADGGYNFALDATQGGFVDRMAQGEKWNLSFGVTASDGKATGEADLTICIEGSNEPPTFTQLAYKDYLGQEQAAVDASGTWVVEAAEQGRWRGDQGNSNRVSDHSDVLTGSFAGADRDNGESAHLKFGAEFNAGFTSGGNKDALESLGDLNLKSVDERTYDEPTPVADHADKGTNNYTELAPGNYKIFHFDVGDFYLNVDTGAYYFNVNDDSDLVNRMNLDDTHSLNFSVTVTDEHGASASHDFTINISGRNDRPELTVEQGISTTDSQTARGDLHDLVEINDADLGDSHKFFIVKDPTADGRNPEGNYAGSQEYWASNILKSYYPVNTLAGKYGVLTVNPDGSYEYRLYGPGEGHDDVYNAVKALPEGEALTDEVFHIAVQDKNGAFDIKELPIEVKGSNNAPVVTYFGVDVKEIGKETDGLGGMHDTGPLDNPDGSINTSYQGWVGNAHHKLGAKGNVFTDHGANGQLIVSDPDQGDQLEVSIAPRYGKDGGLHFDLTHVAQGQDAGGLTPVLNGAPATDPATGVTTISTNYGTLTFYARDYTAADGVLHKAGDYSFDLNPDGVADMLAQGQKLVLSFVLTATDAHGQSGQHYMAVNIQGANEAPTLSLSSVGDGQADLWAGGAAGTADQAFSGRTTVDDQGQPHTVFGIREEGVDEMGQPVGSDIYTGRAVADDADYGHSLTFGLALGAHGPDDTQARRDAFNGGVKGDGVREIKGAWGTLTMAEDGTYTYTLNSDANELEEGKQPENPDTFTIYVRDEHGAWTAQTVTFQLTGSNDKPVVTDFTDEMTLKEAGVYPDGNDPNAPTQAGREPAAGTHVESLSGKITATDVEGDNLYYGVAVSGTPPVFVVDPQSDPAIIAELTDKVGQVQEGKTDLEHPTQSITTSFGTLVINCVTGEYTYTLHTGADGRDSEEVNLLPLGATVTETFTVYVADGKGGREERELTVTIQGTNERPEISHDRSTGFSQGTLEIDGTLAFDIRENNDAAQQAVVHGRVIGSDADNDNGAGEDTVADTDTGLVFSIASESFASAVDPDLAGEGVSAPQKDSGKFVEDGEEGWQRYETAYGTLRLNQSSGEYTFTPKDDLVNGLGRGQTITDTFTIRVRDAHGAYSETNIQISIEGANDKPVITDTSETLTVTEDGFNEHNKAVDKSHDQTGGKVGATDVDLADQGRLTYFFSDSEHQPVTFGVGDPIGMIITSNGASTELRVTGVSQDGSTITTAYGSFHLNTQTGEYSFAKNESPDSATDKLQLGDQVTLNLTVGVRDPHGAVADELHNVKVVLNGSNDRPSATMSDITVKEAGVHIGNTATAEKDAGDLKAGDHRLTSGTLSVSGLDDVDDDPGAGFGPGADQFHIGLKGSDHCSTPQNADGTWTMDYMLSKGGDNEQIRNAITRGDFPQEILNTLEDQLRAEGILGKNEKLSSNEPESQKFQEFLESVLSRVALGTLTVNPDGSYSFALAPEDSAGGMIVNMLGENYNSSRTVYFTVTDPHGGVHDGKFKIYIQGSNDRPSLVLEGNDHITISSGVSANGTAITEATVTLLEDNGAVSGSARGTDVDAGHNLTYAVAQGHKGDVDSTDSEELLTAFDNKTGTGKPHTEISTEYGTLRIDSTNGEYTYTPREELVAGKVYTDEFTIFVRDEHGAWSQQHVTVKVTGSADAPVIKGELPAAVVAEVTEAGVAFNTNTDVKAQVIGKGTEDLSDTHFKLGSFEVSQTDSQEGHGDLIAGFVLNGVFHEGDLETPYGTLHIEINNGVATYSFILPPEGTPEAEALNALTPEDRVKLFDGLKVGVYDSAHASLVGANKGATDDDGNFFFVIDPDHAGLVPGQAVDIYVHGTNDRPYFETDAEGNLAVGNAQHVSEDGGQATGTLLAHDYDNADGSLRFSIVDGDKEVQVLRGRYGILTLDEKTGAYTYTLTADPADYQHLNPGQLLELEDFTVRVTDPLRAHTDATLSFQAQGGKDGATLSGANLQVAEDGGWDLVSGPGDAAPRSDEATLKLHATDTQDQSGGDHALTSWTVGHGDETSPLDTQGKQDVDGTFGKLVLEPAGYGEWTYHYELTHNSQLQSMARGETREETFTVTGTNEQGDTVSTTITVTVNGTNDKPVLDAVTTSGAVKAGVFEADISDTTDTKNPGVVFTGTVKGHDNDHALNGEGQVIEGQTESVTYQFLVIGKDGNPVRGEDGNYLTTNVVKTAYGSFVIDPVSGTYQYILDNENVDRHNLEGKTETVRVVAVDIHGAQSDPRDITITLHNADNGGSGGDGPGQGVIFGDGDLVGAAKEDTNQVFKGHLNAVHPEGQDAPDRVFGLQDDHSQVQTQVNGAYGYLTIDPASGDYTYTLYNGQDGVAGPVQSLGEGETGKDSFVLMLNGQVVTDKNGDPVTIDITVTGTNDEPVIDGFVSDQGNTLQEDATNGWGDGVLTGRVQAHDIDTRYVQDGQTYEETLRYRVEGGERKDDGTWQLTVEGGTLILDPVSGEYNFKVDHDHLTHGTTDTVSFTIVVTDGSGATDTRNLDILLKGVNRGPEAQAGAETEVLQVTEDDLTSATSGKLAGLVFTDDEGAGNLSYSLTDHPDGGRVSMATGRYGTLIFNEDGTYTYILDNQSQAVQGLGANDTETETFKVTVWDQHGASREVEIKVEVHGTNDAPVATVDRVIVVKEGDAAAGNARIEAHDNDRVGDTEEPLTFRFDQKTVEEHNARADAAHQWTLGEDGKSLTTEYGTYRVGADGTVSFELNNASPDVIGLGAGELADQDVYVSVSDGQEDGTITQKVTVNIEGTNSAPQVTHIVTNEADPLVEDAARATFAGRVTAADPDHGDKVVTYMFQVNGELVSSADGKYGRISIDEDGNYTYTLDKTLSQSLAEGQTEHENFQVVAVDSYGKPSAPADLEVAVSGTNDAPVITGTAPNLRVTEGKTPHEGHIAFSDKDLLDEHTVTVRSDELQGRPGHTAEGKYGTLTIDDKGAYTFTANDSLAEGETKSETFTVTVDDQHGGTATQTITVTVSGTNDTPVITSQTSDAEARSGSFSFIDADLNDTHDLYILYGDQKCAVELDEGGKSGTCDVPGLGTFRLQCQNNSWTYVLTAGAVEALIPAGEDRNETFRIQVDDGHAQGIATTDDLTVTLRGSNVPPQLVPEADQPELSAGDLMPDGELDAAGDLNDLLTDPDSALHFSFSGAAQDRVEGSLGTLNFNPDSGEYTYSLDTSEDGLHRLAEAIVAADGKEVTDSFRYTASDQVNAGVDGTLEITLKDLPRAQLGNEQSDTLGDQNGDQAQLLFGEGGHDLLFGGHGDDILFGGSGNDYLDGGSGVNHLYGGAGNDILVFNGANGSTYDGGSGIDFLLADGASRETLDSLLGGDTPAIKGLEVIVTNTGNQSLTGMDDLADKMGIQISDDGAHLNFGEGWSGWTGEEGSSTIVSLGGTEYVQMSHAGDPANGMDDMTLLVQKALLENHQG